MAERYTSHVWFEIEEPEPGVFTIVEPIVMSYLVVGQDRALLLDTGMGVGDMRSVVADLTDRPLTVVNSHAHWDHIGGDRLFPEIAIHEAEAADLARGIPNAALRRYLAPERLPKPTPPTFDIATAEFPPVRATRLLQGGETYDLGGWSLEVIHAPGHSPGGIVLLDRARGVLFSTDVAYSGALYCQLDHSDLNVYRQTMARLAALAPELRTVYPCHDGSPMSPALLPRMRDALDAVAAGRASDSIADGVAAHEFGVLGVLVRAEESKE